jgi:hypothetical protein
LKDLLFDGIRTCKEKNILANVLYVQPLEKDGRNADDMLFAVIKEDNTCFGPDHFRLGCLVSKQIGNITAFASNVSYPQVNLKNISVKNLGLVDYGCIGDQDAVSADIPFLKSKMVEKAGPGLLSQSQNRIVAHVAAEINIIDAYGDFGGEYIGLG